jgi:hypothetical protein
MQLNIASISIAGPEKDPSKRPQVTQPKKKVRASSIYPTITTTTKSKLFSLLLFTSLASRRGPTGGTAKRLI